MEVAVEDLSSLRKALTITLPEDFVAPRLETAYNKLKRKVSLKGFRKGKVPRKVLERTYGDQVKAEVADELVQETYFDALAEVKIEAVVHPDIRTFDYTDEGGFSYVAEVEVKPEFELGEYKGLTIEHPPVEVTDEEVEEALMITRREMAPLKSHDAKEAADGDLVIIDFQGFHDGKPMHNVAGDEYPVDIGSGRNGKEFEEAMIGLKKGEETTREISFPADFPNQVMAGKTIKFEITVKDVKERLLPELDDEFAKDVSSEYATLDDLRAGLREKLQKEKEETADGDIMDKIMQKLIDSHDFELPARLIAYEINQHVEEIENNLQNQGLTLESAGMNREQLAEHFRETAERRVKGDFILKKIAEVEEIKIANDDIEAGYERIAKQYNMQVSEVKQYFQSRNELLPFMNELLSEKVLKFLRAEAKVVPPAADDTDEAQAGTESGESAS